MLVQWISLIVVGRHQSMETRHVKATSSALAVKTRGKGARTEIYFGVFRITRNGGSSAVFGSGRGKNSLSRWRLILSGSSCP